MSAGIVNSEQLKVLNKLKMKYDRDIAWEIYYLYLEFGNKFWNTINLLPNTNDISVITEYVKAIAHSLDVAWFSGVTDASKLIEMRKLLEHIRDDFGIDTSAYKSCALAYKLVAIEKDCDAKTLYEVRRLAKIKAYDTFIQVCYNLAKYSLFDWRVVDAIYRIRVSDGILPYLVELIIMRASKARKESKDAYDRYLVTLLE